MKNWSPESKVCILPWVQLQLSADGCVKTCCAQDGTFCEDPRIPFSEVFNFKKARAIRSKFTQNRIPKECSRCVRNSEYTETFMRVKNPQWAHWADTVFSRSEKSGKLDAPIRYLDIRLSSRCNFTCRTCDSKNSHKWKNLDKLLGRPVFECTYWDDDAKVMQNVFDILPGLEELNFAGGEALIQDGHMQILKRLIEIGRTDIRLAYNTNLSVRAYKKQDFFPLWSQFNKVELHPSMDSIGKAGEYIRQGFVWPIIEHNIYYFKTFIRSVQAMVSVYNIYSILEQIEWTWKNFGLANTLSNVYGPLYMATTILSKVEKDKVALRYEQFIRQTRNLIGDIQRKDLETVLEYMYSADNSHLAPKFKQINSILDREHKTNFCKTFPQLADWYSHIPFEKI